MPAGRPSTYTVELTDKICKRLSEGESLRSICRDDDMPDGSTIFQWIREHPEFSKHYAYAKEESAESYAEKISDVGDRVLKGDYDPAAARVAIDAFKWTSSKLKPKKYGDRIHNEHSGSVSANLTDDQLDERLKALLDAQPK